MRYTSDPVLAALTLYGQGAHEVRVQESQVPLGAWKYAKKRGHIVLVPYAQDGRELRSIGRVKVQGSSWYVTRHGIHHGMEAKDVTIPRIQEPAGH